MKLSQRAQESLRKVLHQFQSGDLSPITQVVRIRLADNAPAAKWSLSNKVLAYSQAGELDCRGFRQWERAGRKIKKGERAVYILRPVMVKNHHLESTQDDEYLCLGFSTVPVFAASSTQGEGMIPSYQPSQLPPLAQVAEKLGISVEYVPVGGDKLGDCQTDGSKIRLGTHQEKVFFHELAHAIHAHLNGQLERGQQTKQETVAEFTSAVLMQLYGLGDTTGNAWRYISTYAQDPLLAITKALGTVEQVLAVLMEGEEVVN